MRERLVAGFVGLAVAVVLLYGVPRAYLLADLVSEHETDQIERTAELLALVTAEREAQDEPTDSAFFSRHLEEGDSLEYLTPGGARIVAGPLQEGGGFVATRPVPGGGTLTVLRSQEQVDRQVSAALLPLVVLGLGLVVVAGAGSYLLARRLSRPFAELAQAAEHLGRGRFDVHFPHYSIPEAEAIGEALRRGSSQLDELVQREREFAANASHQLRTPITALRLQLEDLSMWPETPPEVSAELTSYLSELDRLSGSITEILDLARGRRLGDAVEVDLDLLLGDVASRWEPQVEARGRELVREEAGPTPALVVPGPVIQVLDVLIENACSHGRGTITLRVRERGELLEVQVGDEGPLTIDDAVFHRGHSATESTGSGLGLAIASRLASSVGGRLTLLDDPTTTFALVLPHGPDPRPLVAATTERGAPD